MYCTYTCHWSRCVLKFLYFWPFPNKCPIPAFQHIRRSDIKHPNVNKPTTDTGNMSGFFFNIFAKTQRRKKLNFCPIWKNSRPFLAQNSKLGQLLFNEQRGKNSNLCQKTQNMGKKLRIFPQNSTQGQPPAVKWCPTTVGKKSLSWKLAIVSIVTLTTRVNFCPNLP